MTVLGKSPTGQKESRMRLERDGFQLVVTVAAKKGDVKAIGHIEGHEIHFYYVRASGAGQFVAKFTGLLGGDRMGGEVDMGALGKSTWRATQDAEI